MLQAASPQLENPTMACACKVENFATAVRVREVRPDVVVPHSKVSQTADILGLVCKTEKVNFFVKIVPINPSFHLLSSACAFYICRGFLMLIMSPQNVPLFRFRL